MGRVLITGGSGALGTALVSKFLEMDYERIVVYSRDEHKQLILANKLGINLRGDGSPVRFFLGDVRDKQRLAVAMRGVSQVVHAAALKVVPAGEYNPQEFIKTNVLGAQNVVDASLEVGVDKVIGISTDKACSPINLYGATKLAAEKIFVAANAYGGDKTKFATCRYGNVTASTGSVVPLWWRMLMSREPVTVTDFNMARFWMTLQEAVAFVLQSLDQSEGGEVFVPNLPVYYLEDLLYALAENAQVDADVTEIGIRPGEKLHESMISVDEAPWTMVKDDLSQYMISKKGRDSWLPVPNDFSLSTSNAHKVLDRETLSAKLCDLGFCV